MDVETIDRKYEQLTGQSQQTIQAISALAEKLQAAAQSGDQNAREWMLDLKEIALGIRDEQGQVTELLQAIHGFTANQLQTQSQPLAQPEPPAQYQQAPPPQQYAPPPQQYAPQPQQYAPQYQQPGYQPGYPQGGGGMFQRFMGSNFGSAIASGAGFGIGDDLINHLFN